jgi:type 1 fimbriae regulatory protein FimB/type 1 fimbriae regulatory protein FimE
MDLFVVPTAGFDLLYAFVIVRLDRRGLVWINVTTNPTAEWIARQLIEAFPWNGAPGYLIRDRDRSYGAVVNRRMRGMGKGNRHGQRDAAMILICFRHGLRASELCELQWADVEFETATLHLRRAKGGTATTHPLLGDELRALRVLKRDATSPFLFVTERGSPFSVSGLQKLIERAGVEAGLPFKVHPHMLRHATGYALANKGLDTRTLQSYLGHRSIQSTVRYTELAPGRFKNIWR